MRDQYSVVIVLIRPPHPITQWKRDLVQIQGHHENDEHHEQIVSVMQFKLTVTTRLRVPSRQAACVDHRLHREPRVESRDPLVATGWPLTLRNEKLVGHIRPPASACHDSTYLAPVWKNPPGNECVRIKRATRGLTSRTR